MINKIILEAIDVVPEINMDPLLEPIKLGLFDFSTWLSDGIKSTLINITEWLVDGLIDISYWGCMIVGLTAILLYIGGFKESKKYIAGSIIIYILLQILKVAIASVQ